VRELIQLKTAERNRALIIAMNWRTGSQFPYAAFFWPALAAASASESAALMAAQLLGLSDDSDGEHASPEPEGASPSRIALELPTVRLRDFTTSGSGIPALVCTPLSLHGAAIADLAAGHSLVAALRDAGMDRLLMADWRSAEPDMRFLGIDDYLADLNVMVDDVGGLVDLIGLCQGGWLSLVYAARFPAKVRKLVMAGAPIDIAARRSGLSGMAEATPLSVFEGLVRLGEGRVIGRNVARFWGGDSVGTNDIRQSLQTLRPIGSPEFTELEAIYNTWNSCVIDLPGRYYLEVIERLYKRNELASGSFMALGRKIELSDLRLPIYLLAGSLDELVAPEQLFAVERLVGTRREHLRHEVARSNHLGLFMGQRTLEEDWPKVARWLQEPCD
jgi:poly-beta-hydroxyalkanoate depolymerase